MKIKLGSFNPDPDLSLWCSSWARKHFTYAISTELDLIIVVILKIMYIQVLKIQYFKMIKRQADSF
jgi:hypothetical protein